MSEIIAYRIADNKLGGLAEWGNDVLKHEFKFFNCIDFVLSIMGFDTPEIDIILCDGEPSLDEEEPLPDNPTQPVTIITQASRRYAL